MYKIIMVLEETEGKKAPELEAFYGRPLIQIRCL
jgi:hypothetical protein